MMDDASISFDGADLGQFEGRLIVDGERIDVADDAHVEVRTAPEEP